MSAAGASTPQTVVLVGATGNLGGRIAHELLGFDGVSLRILVRLLSPADEAKAAALSALRDRGATLVLGDLAKPASLPAAVDGADVVISVVQGGP
ncbi:MAG: NmrA family NAD(P)-binding protein [Microbacteriaceae bacterium]|nr:NmrA family NAD(P)-binding protein [Microbacteriaceae bacterium]